MSAARLLYVAMTRAKRDLTLTVPMHGQSFGRHKWGGNDTSVDRSRFIPDGIVKAFDVKGLARG